MYHSTLRYLAISHFDKDINNIEIGWRKKKRINILLMGESGNWRRTLHWYWNAGTERENCFQYLPSLTHASSLLRFRVKINLKDWYKIQFNLRGKWLPVIRRVQFPQLKLVIWGFWGPAALVSSSLADPWQEVFATPPPPTPTTAKNHHNHHH